MAPGEKAQKAWGTKAYNDAQDWEPGTHAVFVTAYLNGQAEFKQALKQEIEQMLKRITASGVLASKSQLPKYKCAHRYVTELMEKLDEVLPPQP